jgi:hypothetical protein
MKGGLYQFDKYTVKPRFIVFGWGLEKKKMDAGKR